MQTRVDVRVAPGGPWRTATLTTDHPAISNGQPVVVVVGETSARCPGDVDAVRVRHDCPVTLADAAVEAGFHVMGQPRG